MKKLKKQLTLNRIGRIMTAKVKCKTEWINVNESLPKEGELVLTFRSDNDYALDYIKYFHQSPLWMRKHKDEEEYPTHWMSLPASPEIKDEDD